MALPATTFSCSCLPRWPLREFQSALAGRPHSLPLDQLLECVRRFEILPPEVCMPRCCCCGQFTKTLWRLCAHRLSQACPGMARTPCRGMPRTSTQSSSTEVRSTLVGLDLCFTLPFSSRVNCHHFQVLSRELQAMGKAFSESMEGARRARELVRRWNQVRV